MNPRAARLNELLRAEVTRALRLVKDHRLMGMLTVTGVELSPDYKEARVYYSVMGSAEDKKDTAKALLSAEPFMRNTIGERIRLRVLPKLVFKLDETPEKADRIERLLSRIEAERQDRPPEKN